MLVLEWGVVRCMIQQTHCYLKGMESENWSEVNVAAFHSVILTRHEHNGAAFSTVKLFQSATSEHSSITQGHSLCLPSLNWRKTTPNYTIITHTSAYIRENGYKTYSANGSAHAQSKGTKPDLFPLQKFSQDLNQSMLCITYSKCVCSACIYSQNKTLSLIGLTTNCWI